MTGAILASKSLKLGPTTTTSTRSGGKSSNNKATNNEQCSYCGSNKHTRETCFKFNGYPEWWTELQAKKRKDGTDRGMGKAAVADATTDEVVVPHLFLILPGEIAQELGIHTHGHEIFWSDARTHNCTGVTQDFSPHRNKNKAMEIRRVFHGKATSTTHRNETKNWGIWQLDSGASDYMTFDAADFSELSLQKCMRVENSNGVISPVTGAGTMNLSPNLKIFNTLPAPSVYFKKISRRRSLGMVLGEETYTRISVWDKHIT